MSSEVALLVVFAAMSQVKRVKRILEADGAYYEIERSPHCISTGGCSVSIRCTPLTLPLVLDAAGGLGIEPKGVHYERQQDGSLSYAPYLPG
ncbi:MAG: hypothetical protein H6Q00_112 [Holophagaceae bacterium]|nr:hypothetical protein [Holophagaceae bacterium]